MKLPDNVRVIECYHTVPKCYAIGFRESKSDILHWASDDVEYAPHSIDAIYDFYSRTDDDKVAATFREFEKRTGEETTHTHTMMRTYKVGSRLLAPWGIIKKSFYNRIGGIDRRFIGTEWENDLSLRIYEKDGYITTIKNAILYTSHEETHGEMSHIKYTLGDGVELMRQLYFKDNHFVNRTSDVRSYVNEELCQA